MIYTVTLNPSVDYYIRVDTIDLGQINRFDTYQYSAGGKGINCSKILDLFSVPSKAVYFCGGLTGQFIDQFLKKYSFIEACPINNEEGATRINVKVLGGQETAFNSGGPVIGEKAKEELLKAIDELNENDYLMINGNLPKNVDKDYVKQICRKASDKKAKVVLDVPNMTAEDLKGLDIFLIKPNIDEFRFMLNEAEISEENFKDYLPLLHECGVRNILLSFGGRNAYYDGEAGSYAIRSPKVTLYKTVGAGDSMLAAYVGQLSLNKGIEEALRYGGATGTAMVMSEDLPDRTLIEEVAEKTEVRIDR